MKQLLILIIIFCSVCVQADPMKNVDPIKYYKEAFENIKKMLEGELQPSFRDAVFLTENAYAEGDLHYVDYMLEIASIMQDVQAIRSKLALEYNYFDKYDVYTNAAIFQYFTDTVLYQDSSRNIAYTKYPYQYNFSDPLGEKDWSNMFVSSLMESNKGNCHSLPYLYKIIANEFKVNAHLVVAPNHLYITHLCHDPAITWYNSELTSGTHPIDSWIMISTYMSMDAVRSGIYGLPLEEKQSIALTLVDLANGYIRKFPEGDKSLAIDCLNLALKHFPRCINAMLLKLQLLSKAYQVAPTVEQKAEIDILAKKIHELGYDEMPRKMYEDWLSGKREYDPNYKPFKDFNEQKNKEYSNLTDKPLLTASNGRYLEYHWTDSLELIGNILYDTKQKKVAEILTIDTTDIVSRIPRDVASRWLSPDPLEHEFPNMSPYNGFNNNPILYEDPDGQKVIISYLDTKTNTVIELEYAEGMKANTGNAYADNAIASLNYLRENEVGHGYTVDVIGDFVTSEEFDITIQFTETNENAMFNSTVDHRQDGTYGSIGGNIHWNDLTAAAYRAEDGSIQTHTAAFILFHEFGEAHTQVFDLSNSQVLQKSFESDAQYGNKLEKYNIKTYEHWGADQLGIKRRKNHRANVFEVNSPLTTKPSEVEKAPKHGENAILIEGDNKPLNEKK